MKQHYLTSLRGFLFAIISLFYLNFSLANRLKLEVATLACNDSIHLSLGANCEAIITPDVVLEAPDFGNSYRIFITKPMDSLGNYENNGMDNVRLLKTGTYVYSIIDSSGRFCSGTIIAEDKIAPTFISLPRDTFVTCNLSLTESGIGATPVVAMDNCGIVRVSFESAFEEETSACNINVIASLWKAVDAFGNTKIDTQRTVFIQPTSKQFILPTDVILSCGEDDPSDINNFTKTGSPSVQRGKLINRIFIPMDTVSFAGRTSQCNFGISSRDIIQNYDCEVKVTRIWDVIDWCSVIPVRSTIDTQFIYFLDTLAPIFEAHEHGNFLNPRRVSLNEQCQFDVVLSPPNAMDNCDTLPTIEMYEVAQLVNGSYVNIGPNINAISLPADTLRLGYRTFDNCLQQPREDTTFTYLITVDVTAPAVICASELSISIANNQGVILDAATVDDGSFDACGPITKAIRRKGVDSIWHSAILLPCELIDSQLVIEFRITDAAGNENFCWTSVRLEDKVSPSCQDLPAEMVTCAIIKANDYGLSTDLNNNGIFEDVEWRAMTNNQMVAYNQTFGTPACLENIACKFFTVEQHYQRVENTCGMAQIKRRFRGIDEQGNIGDWAEQEIRVNYETDWMVTFSPDWEGSCNDIIPIPFIKIQNGACDNLSISIIENTFLAEDDYCLKVERIYQIINPCLLTPSTIPLTIIRSEDLNRRVTDSLTIRSDSLGANAHLLYKQILKIRSAERPTLAIQDVATCLSGIHTDSINTKVDSLGSCAENRTFTAAAKDCVGNEITRFQWNFYEEEILMDSGTGNNFTKATLSNIDYTVQFIAIDACNNQAEERKDFTFLDCAKPILFTRTGIALELTEKAIEIWATDFDNGSSDNCTDRLTLLDNFRIWHPKLGFDYPEDIASIKALPKNLTFTCAELATQEVFIYTFDRADNFAYISAFTAIQDNKESCLVRDRVNILGEVMNEKGERIEGVTMQVSGDMEMTEMTDISGQYLLDLPKGKNYIIEPIKTINPLNGITTFDLILINKHILGIAPFSSPYQHIAADVNKSGTITAFDLVQLRKLILNLIPDFPNNHSWRFIDRAYEFKTNTPAKEDFTEHIELNGGLLNQIEFNFIGIKIGDINGSAAPNNLHLANSRNTKEIFTIELQDRWLKTGEIIEVPFTINNMELIAGLQFTLNFEGLEIINLTEGAAAKEHFNLRELQDGQLSISWNNTPNLTTDNVLFTLTFSAKKENLLSELLNMVETDMLAEVYTNDEKILAGAIQFTSKSTPNKFELFQNKPNPFYKETAIPFYLPKSESVQLRILDLRGQVLKTMVGDYAKGVHEIKINQQNLGAVGVLYYQLTAGEYFAAKKMVLLN